MGCHRIASAGSFPHVARFSSTSGMLRSLLVVNGVVESTGGLAALLFPQRILDEWNAPSRGPSLSRAFGVALIAIGATSFFAARDRGAQVVVGKGALVYHVMVAGTLAHAAAQMRWFRYQILPLFLLHSIMALLLGRSLLK